MKINDDELRLINKHSRKELTEDEVYTFSVVLCDNEIDRDNEHFSDEALEKLAELYVGVTGIYDHDPSAKNQVARIYACEVKTDAVRKTTYGAPYKTLVARAYIKRTDKTKELIDLIDGGIRKEVSVGCGIGRRTCSICGNNINSSECRHVKGRTYNGKKCAAVLEAPTDAYEWSFIAVPAQKNAGVIKSYSFDDPGAEDRMNDLKKKANEADRYRDVVGAETLKAGIAAKTCIPSSLLGKMVSALELDELVELKRCFEKAAESKLPGKRQTHGTYNFTNGKKPDVSGYII